MIRLAIAFVLFCAGPVLAQPFPNAETTLVNDFAGLLDTGAEAQIADSLQQLRDDHGVEMTVVTIESRNDYGEFASIEVFATGLFNAWGVGSAERNDGIMVLVARIDREMRIELGSAYPGEWDAVAQAVIDDTFLPAFRDDAYQRGIKNGTRETILRIAQPFAVGIVPTERREDRSQRIGLFAGIGLLFAAIFARGPMGDILARFKRCPQCGTRNSRRRRRVMEKATRTDAGRRETRTYCTNCDYEDNRISTIPRRTRSSSSSGFGGGSSSGGGASGRW